MTSEAIHLLSLIAVRALAEYDPIEFRRSTDLSKRQIDERIDDLLPRVSDEKQTPDLRLFEIKEKLHELRTIVGEAQTQIELSFLLRQLSLSCLQRAQQLAFQYSRTSEARTRESVGRARSLVSVTEVTHPVHEQEYLRLGVMRLLRELPRYTPQFGYRLRNARLDCLLEPDAPELPVIFIDGKLRLVSIAQIRRCVAFLKKVAVGWGKDVLTAILTTSVAEQGRRDDLRNILGSTYLLLYNPESNEFTEGLNEFVMKVHGLEAYHE